MGSHELSAALCFLITLLYHPRYHLPHELLSALTSIYLGAVLSVSPDSNGSYRLGPTYLFHIHIDEDHLRVVCRVLSRIKAHRSQPPPSASSPEQPSTAGEYQKSISQREH